MSNKTERWILLTNGGSHSLDPHQNISQTTGRNREANSNLSAFSVSWTDLREFCEQGNLVPSYNKPVWDMYASSTGHVFCYDIQFFL